MSVIYTNKLNQINLTVYYFAYWAFIRIITHCYQMPTGLLIGTDSLTQAFGVFAC